MALVSERLSVVAGGRSGDAAFFLVVGQLREGIARAAFLETSGALQVVELAVDLHAADLAQCDGRRTWRIEDRAGDTFARGSNVIERDHARGMCAQDRQSTTRAVDHEREQEKIRHPGRGGRFGRAARHRMASVKRTWRPRLFHRDATILTDNRKQTGLWCAG